MRNEIPGAMSEARRLVVDSCVLQSDELRRFLKASEANFAALPDFIWFEFYKQESIDAIVVALSVLGGFPNDSLSSEPERRSRHSIHVRRT